MVLEKVDWSRAPADTPVCEEEGIFLRDRSADLPIPVHKQKLYR